MGISLNSLKSEYLFKKSGLFLNFALRMLLKFDHIEIPYFEYINKTRQISDIRINIFYNFPIIMMKMILVKENN